MRFSLSGLPTAHIETVRHFGAPRAFHPIEPVEIGGTAAADCPSRCTVVRRHGAVPESERAWVGPITFVSRCKRRRLHHRAQARGHGISSPLPTSAMNPLAIRKKKSVIATATTRLAEHACVAPRVIARGERFRTTTPQRRQNEAGELQTRWLRSLSARRRGYGPAETAADAGPSWQRLECRRLPTESKVSK